MSRLKLVTIDRQAIEPLGPIKPQKALIVAVGLVFGLMLALVLAFVRHTIQARRLGGLDTSLPSHSSASSKTNR